MSIKERFNTTSNSITVWFDKCNYSISVGFVKNAIKYGIRWYNNGARKYIDNCYSFTFDFFGIEFNYTNWNYNKVMHINIYGNKNYTHLPEGQNIRILKQALNLWSINAPVSDLYFTDECYGYPKYSYLYENSFKPPFKFKWTTIDGECVFHLTVKKQWLLDNGFTILTNYNFLEGDRLMEQKHLFP